MSFSFSNFCAKRSSLILPEPKDISGFPSQFTLQPLEVVNSPCYDKALQNSHYLAPKLPPRIIALIMTEKLMIRSTCDWSFDGESFRNIVLKGNSWHLQPKREALPPSIFERENVRDGKNGIILKAKLIDRRADDDNVSTEMSDDTELGSSQENVYWDVENGYSLSWMQTKSRLSSGYIEVLCKFGDSALTSSISLRESRKPYREITLIHYSRSNIAFKGAPLSHFFISGIRDQSRSIEHYSAINMQKNIGMEMIVKLGLLWTRKSLYWFLNDQLIREMNHNGMFSHVDMNLEISRECFPWCGIPGSDDRFGDFKVYYCKGWRF